MKVKAVFFGVIFAIGLNAASAQSIIDQASRQANEIDRQNAAREAAQRLGTVERVFRAPQGEGAEAPVSAVSGLGATCIEINTISVAGVNVLPRHDLETALAKWEGKCLGLVEINNVLEAVTYLYMSHGFIAARAYIPEQDLASGHLAISVMEGKLDRVQSPNETVNSGQIKSAFPGMAGKPVNLRDIEQGLDQINRLRSQKAQIELRAGDHQGVSFLDVTIAKTKPWWTTTSTNNYGGYAVGQIQSRIDIGFDNVLGLNDEWTVGYHRSMRDRPFSFSGKFPHSNGYNASLSIPFGYWLFGVDGSWSNYRTTLESALNAIETSGHSTSLSVFTTRILHRNQVSKTWMTGRITRKTTDNFLLGNRIDANSRVLAIATMELGHSRQFGGGNLTALLGFHQGIRALNAERDEVNSAHGHPKAQFSKLTGSLSYGRPFTFGTLNTKVRSTVSGQLSGDVLFGSEQLALGGQSTVRGTRESLFYGNNGFYWRNELSAPLEPLKNPRVAAAFGQLEPYVAVDVGHAFGRENKNAHGGSVVGAAVGIRNIGGKLNFDIFYANIVAASLNALPSRPSRGLLQARLSISF